jgi:membrane-associated phospholipid phosphatase
MGRLRSCVKFGWPLVTALLLATVGIAVFVSLALEVIEQEAFGFDRAILTWLYNIASPALTQLALAVTLSAAHYVLIPLMLTLAALMWRRWRVDWLALAVSLGGASVVNLFVKTLFARARPTLFEPLTIETGFSFPSGHSQAALAFYGVLAYLLARRVSPKWRLPVYIAGGAWVVLVGLSRNYLSVHYPSDVLAAFAMTLPWVLAVIFVHQCYAPKVEGEEKVIKPEGEQAHSPNRAA